MIHDRLGVPAALLGFTDRATDAALVHAARGQITECRRALGEAQDAFTRIDPAVTTLWSASADHRHRGVASATAYPASV